MVMSDLEIDRARKQARGCHILPLSSYQKKLRRDGVKTPGVAEVLPRVLRQKGVRRVTVPFDFPHGLAVQLQRNRISVSPKKGDRKSTRLNSSHGYISYAVFCLKKKKNTQR